MVTQSRSNLEWLHWPSSLSKQLILIAIVASIYYSTGNLGLMLAIPNTVVSPVWPPSGIALAAGLIYGYKIWPAIFLGSFINNIDSFSGGYPSINHHMLIFTGISIGIGSVLQMWAGLTGIYFLIKDKDILGSAKNVFKFLFVGLASCLINANIGTYSLALADMITWTDYKQIFLNWWLGDTAGIFVFTPLIWAWTMYPLPKMTLKKSLEAIALLTCLFIANIILLNSKFPFFYGLIPLMVWGGLRFSHQGATLMVVLTSLIAFWGIFHGVMYYGRETTQATLIFLQTFMGITTVMTLSLGAIVQERAKAYAQLKDINQNLEIKIQERTKEIRSTLEQMKIMQDQIIAQQKLASLGELTAGIAHEIKNPLNFINNFAELSVKQASKLIDFFDQHTDLHNAEETETIKKILDIIISNMSKISHYGQRADGIVKSMLSHSRTVPMDFSLTDVNGAIKEIVKDTYNAKLAQNPSLKVVFNYTLDPSIQKISLIPHEFNRVITNLLDNAFYAVEKKKETLGDQFIPEISVFTKNIDANRVSILIRDNGVGISSQLKDRVFTPFFTTKPPGEGTGLGLSLSRDVIVSAHHGELRMHSEEGEYTEFLIILPKIH